MTETRFPLPGRDEGNSAPADPLETMAAQIRELDAAARGVAERIRDSSSGLGGREPGSSATRADLLAGLAAALVDRTEGIREDCDRLSALMDRTAKLVADADANAAAEIADADEEVVAPVAGGLDSPIVEPKPEPPAPPLVPIESAVDSQLERAFAPLDDELETELEASDDLADVAPPSLTAPDPFALDEAELRADEEELQPGEVMPAPDQAQVDPDVRPEWLAGSEQRPVPPAGGTSEGVRLIATQMAIAGSTRAEIERRLRVQFGVRDADRALDEIFGTHRSEVT